MILKAHKGFTLVELMVVVAILAIISAIAIPAYDDYVQEARYGVARASMDSIRIVLEDYNLDNATYVVGTDTTYDEADLSTNFGWTPDGDGGNFTYEVSGVTATTYTITVKHDDSGDYARCENRMSTCCYGTGTVSACP